MELINRANEFPEDTNLEKILNLSEKGADVIILHPGSQSLKFGLASQLQPFIMPNVIAHKLVKPKAKMSVSFSPTSLSLTIPPAASTISQKAAAPEMQMQITDYVEQALEQKLSYIEPVLCRQKHINIDQKRPKLSKKSHTGHEQVQPLTLNHKALNYQIYTADNSLSHIPENPTLPSE